MKKVIVAIVLFLIIPKAFGQQEYDKQIPKKPIVYLSERLPILNIDTITQREISYISMIRCPQSINPIEILYIIDGLPDSFEDFDILKPENIISTKIIYYNEQYYYCGPPRDIVVIKTINSLTKRKLKQLKRLNREDIMSE